MFHLSEGSWEKLKLDTVSPAGVNLFGGHVFRVSGAQRLAGMGFSDSCLTVLARFSPRVLLRYVREAPLMQITSNFKHHILLNRQSLESPMCNSAGSADLTRPDLEIKLQQALEKITEQSELVFAQLKRQDAHIKKIARAQAKDSA